MEKREKKEYERIKASRVKKCVVVG